MSAVHGRSPRSAPIELSVNGEGRSVSATNDRSLLDCLRFELGLTGTKYGCGEGACGACAVLVDGRAALACRVRAEEVVGKAVVTIEGLAQGENLSEVQRAFLDLAAFQCGFCTPGLIVAATALLAEHPHPTEEELRAALEGHLCRCCGYPRILRAVRNAAEALRAADGRGGGR